ncbi:MAG: hypothetical protein Q9181_002463 [Wetmoreana brouardii]
MRSSLQEYNDSQYSYNLDLIQKGINGYHQHCKDYATPCEHCLEIILDDIAFLLSILLTYVPSKDLVDEYANLSRLTKYSKQLLLIDSKGVCKDIWVLIDRKLRVLDDTRLAIPPPRVPYEERVTDEAAWEEEGQFDEIGRRVDDGDGPPDADAAPFEIIWRPDDSVEPDSTTLRNASIDGRRINHFATAATSAPSFDVLIPRTNSAIITSGPSTAPTLAVSEHQEAGRAHASQSSANASSLSDFTIVERAPPTQPAMTESATTDLMSPRLSDPDQLLQPQVTAPTTVQTSSSPQPPAPSSVMSNSNIIERPSQTTSSTISTLSQNLAIQHSPAPQSAISDFNIIERAPPSQPAMTESATTDLMSLSLSDLDRLLSSTAAASPVNETDEEAWIRAGRPPTVRIYNNSRPTPSPSTQGF